MFWYCFWMWSCCVFMAIAALLDEYADGERLWMRRFAAMLRAVAIVWALYWNVSLYFYLQGGV